MKLLSIGRAENEYLVGESWHTVAQCIPLDSEMSGQLHSEDQLPLRAFHYLQKQIAIKTNLIGLDSLYMYFLFWEVKVKFYKKQT